MKSKNVQSVIKRLYASGFPELYDIEYLLGLEKERDLELLFGFADKVRREFCGDGIIVRAIIEFSSFCRNRCLYCGLNRHNKNLKRYRLSKEEIMAAVKEINAAGIKTIVLQSGEDDELDVFWLSDLVREIKGNYDIVVTLSVGERSKGEYMIWKDAGADRYLLKIETSDETLYRCLHPEMSFENRINCSSALRALGYQIGSGCIVGLRGQTIPMLARDIMFFKEEDFDMLGIGIFIPHENTPLGKEPLGSMDLTLKTLAVTRIVTKNTHLPATTAIGSLGGTIKALNAGANVIMLNFTPEPYRDLYEIYPGKNCLNNESLTNIDNLEAITYEANRWINYSAGDSLKYKHTLCAFE
ncbi:MAG: [FeFe] hydrogenase H-cluster radical SAM maturase HydE [Sedimentisphaerales bacterium]|nr:[FeFe] hydrogenase H-cluster radical SAM maturase HydE [Sedimentisphaerales bacterium]